ncbi:uncharacterized protein LOC144744043 [Ciona intestinalis]
MEKRIKKLEEEVTRLKAENSSLQQTYKQLVEESKVESYDARRSLMLKSQIIQLERQCMLLSDALSSRTDVLVETENALIALISNFQELLANEETGPTVKISRKQLVSDIHQMQRLKGSMFKQQVLCSSDQLKIPQLTGCKFSNQPDLTCIDVCKAESKHLNLVHVSKLEDDLAKLYKQLHEFETVLELMLPSSKTKSSESKRSASAHLFSKSFEKLKSRSEECKLLIEKSCQDLLSVSLLYPSAPWSVIQRPEKFGAFAPSAVLNGIAPAIRRRADVKSTITALCKAHSYLVHMHKLEMAAVKTAVTTSKEMNSIYSDYAESLLENILEAYTLSEKNLTSTVCEPMESILSAWVKLKNSQSDNALRLFLSTVKEHENVLRDFSQIDSEDHSLSVSLDKLKTVFLLELQAVQQRGADDAEKARNHITTHREEKENVVLEILKELRISQK